MKKKQSALWLKLISNTNEEWKLPEYWAQYDVWTKKEENISKYSWCNPLSRS